MKNNILKVKQRTFLKILGLFGVSITLASCYGSPSQDYKYNTINGTIRSSLDSSKIKDIKVISERDTVITDLDGNFSITKMDLGENNKIDIKILDVDSSLNGSFENKFATVIFKPLKEEGYTEETIEKDFYLNPKNEN